MQRYLTAFAVALAAGYADAQCQTARLVAGDTAYVNENFGTSLGLSQGALLIGAKNARVGSINSGAAYIFRQSGGGWNLEARLGPTPVGYKQFGSAVSIDGDVCLIGAPGENTGLINAGAAYIFRRVSGSWTQEARLVAPDPQAGDQLGTTCAISGDLAVLGTPFKSDIAVQLGAAYIYERVGGVWSAGTRIDMNDGTDAAFFGSSVTCAPGIVIVAAGNKTTAAGSEGAVYIFRKVGSNWVRDPRLTPSDAAQGDGFGSFVWLSGSAMLIGAYSVDGPAGADQGAAYIFRAGLNDSWTQEAKIFGHDSTAGDLFGSSGSLSGDRAVVGSYRASIAPGTNQGAAYIFTRSGSTWPETAKVNASDPNSGDAFSIGAAIDGTTVTLGAQFQDGAQSNSGAVYVYSAAACACYANCDGSTVSPILNINDFICFMNNFAVGNPYANCDSSTVAPVLNVNDFQCFINKFAIGCP